MHIIFSPIGSAGDTYPLAGLALEMQRRGHEITFVCSGYFEPLARRLGFEFVELTTREEFLELSAHPDLWSATRGLPYILEKGVKPYMREHYEIVTRLQRDEKSLVIGTALGFGARIAQEKHGFPMVTVHLQPGVMWSRHKPPKLSRLISGPFIPNWLVHLQFRLASKLVVDRLICPTVNAFRSELDLEPVRNVMQWWNSPDKVLGFFPEWYAPLQPDWPPQTELTGFPLWDEDDDQPLPPDVQQFLDDGEPPVVFTPGSAMQVGEKFFAAAAGACRMLGRRGMLMTKFKQHLPPVLPEGVAHFEYAAFKQLLPHAAAIVHHGGMGTTAQSLRAGIPQLVMPMAHDQPDNADRLKRFGVGDWLKPKAFTADRVANQLSRLLESASVAAACRELVEKFCGPPGISLAADVLEKCER